MHEAMIETVEALAPDPADLALPADRLALGIGALVDGVAFGRLLRPGAIPDDLLGQMLALLWGGDKPAPSRATSPRRSQPRPG